MDKDKNRRQNQRPQDGPPDLDELWRDFNRRLNGLLGRKDNGRVARTSATAPVRRARVRTSAWASSWRPWSVSGWPAASSWCRRPDRRDPAVRQVQVHDRPRYQLAHALAGPVGRGGQPVERALGGGGRATSIKDSNLEDSSMLTQDENIIDVRFTVQYDIQDAGEFLFFNKTDRGGDEELVTQAAETSVREIVGRNRWMRCCTRTARRRAVVGQVDPDDPVRVQDRHPRDLGQRPERAAARAGAGCVR